MAVQLRRKNLVLLGASGLPFQLGQARSNLGQNIFDSLQVVTRLVEFAQRVFAPVAVTTDAGCFFEQCPPLFRFLGQRGIDRALADNGIGAFGQAAVAEQIADLAQAHPAAI